MTHSATRWTTALLLAALIALPFSAQAGLNAGLAAYDKAEYTTALKELASLAEKGNAQAQYRLGKIFNLGQGVPPDKKEAAKWFHLAAQQGLAAAQGALGYLCLVGEGVSQNSDLALEWTRKAAQQGDATAQFNLSVMYGEPFGIQKNPAESLQWLRKAADQRHIEALNALAAFYAKGKDGAPKNPVFAYALFAASAEKGDSTAAAEQKALATGMSTKELQAGKALARKWTPGTRFVHIAAHA
ncbi:tetratricopeptide repeat protein [Rhodoferax sp.]|uniref:tetratricopeptide repeat protein n=1 Tax=Rhodoferax sp. TaxID=50421 RepID=UPI0025FAEB69|nr:tetratricopeptide repeat protein [Rhodoferax sp.]